MCFILFLLILVLHTFTFLYLFNSVFNCKVSLSIIRNASQIKYIIIIIIFLVAVTFIMPYKAPIPPTL